MRIRLEPRERRLGGIGALGALAGLLCILVAPRGALTGWLAAAVLFQAVPLGGIALLTTMRLVRGAWETELRPECEAGALLLPLAALAFVPVLCGMAAIYDWDTSTELSHFQAAWLGYVPFAFLTMLWFAALAATAFTQVGRQAGEGISALALIFITLCGSLVGIDWLMSLDVKFHSSAYGIQLLTLEVGAAYMVFLLARLARPPAPERPEVLGGLLLLMLLLWFYFRFLSFVVIWSGNLPDGAAWYHDRSQGAWDVALWVIGACGMGPMLVLFFSPARRNLRILRGCAAVALFGKAVEFAWLAIPGRGWIAALAYVLALAGFACLGLTGMRIARRQRRREAPA